MADQTTPKGKSLDIAIRHATGPEELAACFPVISALRPALESSTEWVDCAMDMATDGYRVLAAWAGASVVAVAGYRPMNNLIHRHFLYVDDLVSAEDHRGMGLGAALLDELASIGRDQHCQRLVLDTGKHNTAAQRFYARAGMTQVAVGFVKSLA